MLGVFFFLSFFGVCVCVRARARLQSLSLALTNNLFFGVRKERLSLLLKDVSRDVFCCGQNVDAASEERHGNRRTTGMVCAT